MRLAIFTLMIGALLMAALPAASSPLVRVTVSGTGFTCEYADGRKTHGRHGCEGFN